MKTVRCGIFLIESGRKWIFFCIQIDRFSVGETEKYILYWSFSPNNREKEKVQVSMGPSS